MLILSTLVDKSLLWRESVRFLKLAALVEALWL